MFRSSGAMGAMEMAKEEKMKKIYFVCDYTDEKAASIDEAPHVGVEYMGMCRGRALLENGTEVGYHTSSSYGWLRKDLKYHADSYMNGEKYEIVDLIGYEVPEQFRRIK